MQIAPLKELAPFIKHYLFLENNEQGFKKLRLFSDGNTAMVLSFKANLISTLEEDKKLNYLPHAFVYGQISQFKDLCAEGKLSLIVVVFQPSGLSQLLGIAAYEMRDQIIDIEEVFGRESLLLQEKLFEHPHPELRLNLLNTFFLEQITKGSFSNQTLIQASLNFIVKNQGVFTLSQLVKYTGYSERHLERVFNECIGLNPKKVGNIVKLHRFLKILKNKPKQENITRFCYDVGYTDQSHLIKEFKKYTGITPTQYSSANTHKLAVNFLEFNS